VRGTLKAVNMLIVASDRSNAASFVAGAKTALERIKSVSEAQRPAKPLPGELEMTGKKWERTLGDAGNKTPPCLIMRTCPTEQRTPSIGCQPACPRLLKNRLNSMADPDSRARKTVAARTVVTALWLVLTATSCGGGGGGSTDNGRVPLIDLGAGSYLGFTGGLYPNGANTPPAAHATLGLDRALKVQPLDVNGVPNSAGRIVLLSIGMSNTTQEFCSAFPNPPCNSWSFMGQAAADLSVNKTTLAIVNGAAGGQTAPNWVLSTDLNYDRIRDTQLAPQSLSEQQVQVAWVKVARADPTVSLPAANADAFFLLTDLGDIMRALKTRYPNLQQVFLSSRIYGGYATSPTNPEPYAYESGFAVKWLIQAQIDQAQSGVIDARAGDLDPNGVAPWVARGPYLWANGLNPRSDGLVWELADFDPADGTHPSTLGETKVAQRLLDFFENSEFTHCWFLTFGSCP
jgi:hypothetical protein